MSAGLLVGVEIRKTSIKETRQDDFFIGSSMKMEMYTNRLTTPLVSRMLNKTSLLIICRGVSAAI